MSAKRPVFDYATCMACGVCDQACPFGCIDMSNVDVDRYKKAYPILLPARCTGCALCQKACPVDAIEMTDFSHAGGS